MDYIQRQQIINQQGVPTSVRLTFQHWGGLGAVTDEDRWDAMALRVRQAYYYLSAQSHGQPRFQIEIIAGDERARNPMQRLFRLPTHVTGLGLGESFEQMLTSDETLELEGLTIIVTLVGEDMQNAVAQGSGRTLGMNLIPAHLKKKGKTTYIYSRPYDSSGL